MIHPIPNGTQNVLPDELQKIHAITETMRTMFNERKYNKITTPALEYKKMLTHKNSTTADPTYQLFNEHNNVLILRSDMTIPIAHIITTHYPTSPMPLRFCYIQHTYQTVRQHHGHPHEILQTKIELVNAPKPEKTTKTIAILCAALNTTRLTNYQINIKNASLFTHALNSTKIEEPAPMLKTLNAHDFVTLEHSLPNELAQLATQHNSPKILENIPKAKTLHELHKLLTNDIAERVIYDLELLQTLKYYTNTVFEIYNTTFKTPISNNGHYNNLLNQFGRSLPTCN